MDRHVDQKRLLLEVVAAASRRAGRRVAPEVDRHLVELAQGRAMHELGERTRRGKVAVVLAHHENEPGFGGDVDQLMRGAERRREGLLHQDVQSGVERGPRHRHVPRQGGGVQHGLRPRRRDGLLERFEAHLGRCAQLLADDVQRVGVGVDVADELDLADVGDDASRPVPTVRAESDLKDPKRAHGRQ